MSDESNRRKYLRINDRVSLHFQPLSENDAIEAASNFETRRMEFSLKNHLVHGREQHMPQMRVIEKRHPDIANYLKFLEKQIESLSSRLIDQDHCLSVDDRYEVNLSAEGIRFYMPEQFEAGAIAEIAMMVYPSQASMYALGEIIRSEKVEDDENSETLWRTAIHFSSLHEEDREMLIKHIHQLQLKEIRLSHG